MLFVVGVAIGAHAAGLARVPVRPLAWIVIVGGAVVVAGVAVLLAVRDAPGAT